MNQPYLYLTLRSIIEKCGDSFNVSLIDDESFNKIIPGWATRVANLPSPLRPHLRELAMTKLLYYYGGMVIPDSFICFENLEDVYNKNLEENGMFAGELVAKSDVATHVNFFPNTKVMGCNKNNEDNEKFYKLFRRSNIERLYK